MNRFVAAIALPSLVFTLTGCASPAPNRTNYSYLRIQAHSRDAVFNAARRAMQERFRLDKVDEHRGIIRSVPVETTGQTDTHRVGDVVGVKRRLRRIATTRVEGTDNAAEVWCRVIVEEYETDNRRLFDQDRSINDVPTETAAERGGATTPEQNAVWRTSSRDKVLERSILRSISELVSRGAPPAGKTPAPGSTP
jgi:hypothetical protein